MRLRALALNVWHGPFRIHEPLQSSSPAGAIVLKVLEVLWKIAVIVVGIIVVAMVIMSYREWQRVSAQDAMFERIRRGSN